MSTVQGGSEDDAVLVVFNPRAGGGRSRRFRDSIRQALDAMPVTTHWVESEEPGHAESLVRRWRPAVDRVVAIGGDGTIHEVVNGLFDVHEGHPAVSPIAVGVVHTGTGGDFRRGLGIPAGWREQLELALTGPPTPIDILVVEVEGLEGQPRRRVSMNVAGAGMNGRVVELANRSNKGWGGFVTFAWATVQAVIERRIVDVEVEWIDGEGTVGQWCGPLAGSFFANGPYCGHGMWLGRGGSMRDGRLELTLIPELPAMRMLFHIPRLYSGTVDQVSEVVRASAVEVTASSNAGDVMVDLDGELSGRLPLKIRVFPGALLVVAGSPDS